MQKSQIPETHEGVTIRKASVPLFLIVVTEKGNSFVFWRIHANS